MDPRLTLLTRSYQTPWAMDRCVPKQRARQGSSCCSPRFDFRAGVRSQEPPDGEWHCTDREHTRPGRPRPQRRKSGVVNPRTRCTATSRAGPGAADSCTAAPAVASENTTPNFPRRQRTPAGEDRPGTAVPAVIRASRQAEALTPQQISSGFPVQPITRMARHLRPRSGGFSVTFT